MELMLAGEPLDALTEALEWVQFVFSMCGRLHGLIDFDLECSEFSKFLVLLLVLLVIGSVVVVIGILMGSKVGDSDGAVVGEVVELFQSGILSPLSFPFSS